MWTTTDLELIVREAGTRMKQMHPFEVEAKEGHSNFVTECDRQLQEYLYDHLHALIPEANFVGEEEGKGNYRPSYRSGLVLVVDPIDGTNNFITGYRPSVVSVGILKDGKPFIGIVYNPYSDEMFQAEKGKGAFMNGKRIFSSKRSLEESLVVFGTSPYYTQLKERTFRFVRYYYDRCMDIRRSGSSAWDLCCVACGRAGLFFELSLGLWDYAAAACIVQEAGGRVTDDRGNELEYNGRTGVVVVSGGVARQDYLPDTEDSMEGGTE